MKSVLPVAILFVTHMVISSSASADVVDEILTRCETRMSSYGASMVKACVDQDLEAHRALQGYTATDVVARCQKRMVAYGWSMVKACVDQDLEAAEALRRYQALHPAIVDRCMRRMASYGASMVKACAEQDIKAEAELQNSRRR